MNIKDYKRIIIIGNNGSGKSYLADILSESLNLPLIHLDLEYWGPNWTPMSHDKWCERQLEMVSGEKWIIDGNHTSSLDIRFKHADLVIFLDINRWLCFYSALNRLKKKRKDMPSYLNNRLNRDFFIFLKRLWHFDKERKPIIMDLHNQFKETPFFILTSRSQMKTLINNLQEIDTLKKPNSKIVRK